MTVLQTAHGVLPLPAFMPDGTRAFVRTIDPADVADSGIEIMMVNVLHLSSHPGTSLIAEMGGIHSFMGWPKVVACDSGGYQAYSLVAGERKMGSISKDGFTYRLDKSLDKKILTPEKCIQKQFQLRADIMFCLDHCTHPDAEAALQRESVDNTIRWAERCKDEFTRRLDAKANQDYQPLLFAVVQGGADEALRRECAERLLEIGFDGYGYGGWPIDGEGRLIDMVAFTASLLPPDVPKHGLGIGKPDNVVRAFETGYSLFDCVIPTRDARQKRLYVYDRQLDQRPRAEKDFYHFVYLQDKKHAKDPTPVDETCDCACCRRYSRAYLHHLFQSGEPTAARLATLHNLRFYSRLMTALRT